MPSMLQFISFILLAKSAFTGLLALYNYMLFVNNLLSRQQFSI